MDLKRARIVVVDDEKIMCAFLLNALRGLGVSDVYAFADAPTALREISQIKPDLVFTDVHMQPMGGLELVRELRASPDPRVNTIPVIFLSADSTASTVGDALPLGVAGYIVKPPKTNALAAKIEHALTGYQTTFLSWAADRKSFGAHGIMHAGPPQSG